MNYEEVLQNMHKTFDSMPDEFRGKFSSFTDLLQAKFLFIVTGTKTSNPEKLHFAKILIGTVSGVCCDSDYTPFLMTNFGTLYPGENPILNSNDSDCIFSGKLIWL